MKYLLGHRLADSSYDTSGQVATGPAQQGPGSAIVLGLKPGWGAAPVATGPKTVLDYLFPKSSVPTWYTGPSSGSVAQANKDAVLEMLRAAAARKAAAAPKDEYGTLLPPPKTAVRTQDALTLLEKLGNAAAVMAGGRTTPIVIAPSSVSRLVAQRDALIQQRYANPYDTVLDDAIYKLNKQIQIAAFQQSAPSAPVAAPTVASTVQFEYGAPYVQTRQYDEVPMRAVVVSPGVSARVSVAEPIMLRMPSQADKIALTSGDIQEAKRRAALAQQQLELAAAMISGGTRQLSKEKQDSYWELVAQSDEKYQLQKMLAQKEQQTAVSSSAPRALTNLNQSGSNFAKTIFTAYTSGKPAAKASISTSTASKWDKYLSIAKTAYNIAVDPRQRLDELRAFFAEKANQDKLTPDSLIYRLASGDADASTGYAQAIVKNEIQKIKDKMYKPRSAAENTLNKEYNGIIDRVQQFLTNKYGPTIAANYGSLTASSTAPGTTIAQRKAQAILNIEDALNRASVEGARLVADEVVKKTPGVPALLKAEQTQQLQQRLTVLQQQYQQAKQMPTWDSQIAAERDEKLRTLTNQMRSVQQQLLRR